MKQMNVKVANDRGEEFTGQLLAEVMYAGICKVLDQLKGRNGLIDDQLLRQNGVPSILGTRKTVVDILKTVRRPDGTIPESALSPALALNVIGEQPQSFYEAYKLQPRGYDAISFDDCQTVSDILATVYEVQSRGSQIVSTSSSRIYDPKFVAKEIIKECRRIEAAIARSPRDFDINTYRNELRTIPTHVRLALLHVIEYDPRHIAAPKELTDLVMNYVYLPEIQERGYESPPTEYPRRLDDRRSPRENLAQAVAPVIREQQTRSKRPAGWLNKAMACAVTLALGTAGVTYLKHRKAAEGLDEPTPLSTPDMIEDLKKSLAQQE